MNKNVIALVSLATFFSVRGKGDNLGYFYLSQVRNNSTVFVRIQTTHNATGNGVYIKSNFGIGDSQCKRGNKQTDIGIGCAPITLAPGESIQFTNFVIPDNRDSVRPTVVITTYTPTQTGMINRYTFVSSTNQLLYAKESLDTNQNSFPTQDSPGNNVMDKGSFDNSQTFNITITGPAASQMMFTKQ
ncbi:MAG: hypothetical protein ACHQVS_03965 [Candidatus Babeliales bacterium]